MKFLLVVAIVLVGFFVWRSGRAARKPPPSAPPVGKAKVIDMGRCDHCGTHCAATDLLAGRRGAYCSPEHRALAEP